jgi:hypothetical protein
MSAMPVFLLGPTAPASSGLPIFGGFIADGDTAAIGCREHSPDWSGPPPLWDERCAAILHREIARHCTNAQIAESIARETGQRFSVFVVSRYRAALGTDRRGLHNDWSAPLTRERMIRLARR